MLFQVIHSLSENEFTLRKGKEITFPVHIHRSLECFVQISGRTEICIDDNKYLLSAGDAVLIFPFQLHSYSAVEPGEYEICIFSMEIVPGYGAKVNRLVPESNLFSFGGVGAEAFHNSFLQKSIAYRICGYFDTDRNYYSRSKGIADDVMLRMLLFAEEHYCEECSFKEAASSVGYDYAYASKLFKRKIGFSFRKYVNMLRISKSIGLLESTKLSITEIGRECGFNTLRSFNREFLDSTGMTPTEFRKIKHLDSDL